MNAMKVLSTCDFLVKEDCMIISGMVYEKIGVGKYRVFLSSDDYDYIEDDAAIAYLNKLFNARS